MKPAAVLLVISIALLAGSGCKADRVLAVHHEYSRCPRPERPGLPQLNPEEPLCSPGNVEALMGIVDGQRDTIDRQDAALDCYEAQASAGK